MWSSSSVDYYPTTDYDMKAAGWCLSNNIHVYIHCYEPYVYHLAVRINGKENISPENYAAKDVLKKKYEFYKYYYEKYNV